MSGTKFTPGPWSQSHRECHGGGYRTQVYPTNDPDNTIASLHWHGVKIPGGFTTNREANAHLIAAAPELHAALEEVFSSLSAGDDRSDDAWVDLNGTQVQMIVDALAKARGES